MTIFRKVVGFYWGVVGKIREIEIQSYGGAREYADLKTIYAEYKLLSANDANKIIAKKIKNGDPFLAGRFGATELLNMRAADFGRYPGQKYSTEFHFNHLQQWSGFFPNNIKLLSQFVSEMKLACSQVDFLAVWFNPYEDYYISHHMPQLKDITYLLDFEPWSGNEFHWSSALEGKKVLVIHPFANTIYTQYKKRNLLFPGTDILPEFDLKVLKAVQTVAGEDDSRFKTWFEALEWMYNEAMKTDFDIAIIGCGAYGLPLAARLKGAGKQAIHLAGATQLLFGIKGKRWENDELFGYVNKYFNNEWVYPAINEKPKDAKQVENSCYWS